MAMSPEDTARLRKSCQRAKRAQKPMKFFYCVGDQADNPVLIIDKRLQPAEIKEIRRSAAKKRFLTGTVGNEEGNLVFRMKKPQARFLKDLKRYFGQEIPSLRRALMLDMDEPAPEADPEAPGDDGEPEEPEDDGLSEAEREAQAAAEAARERLRAQEEKAEQARAREASARQKVLDLIARIHQEVDDWAELGTDAAVVASLASDRQAALEEHFALLRQYLEGRIARRAEKEGVETDEELEAVARRTEADARNQAYKALLDELRVAQSDLREGAERLLLIDAEIAEAEAAEALAEAEREEARIESLQATAELFEREDELAEIFAQSPAAAPLLAEARALEAEADQLADDAMDLQMELSELEAERDALVASLVDAGPSADPALLGWLGELEGQIQAREQELEALIQQTDAVHAEAGALHEKTREAVEQAGDPRAQRVALQVARAQEAVAARVADEAAAERAVQAAAAEVAEHARQRAVAQVLTEAQAWQSRTAGLLEVLDDIDPRDPAEAARSGALLSQPGVVNALADGQHFFQQLLKAGATAAEVAEIFEPLPATWRPAGYAAQQAEAAAQASWVSATTAPLEDRLAALDAHIAASQSPPTSGGEPRRLAERLGDFLGVPEADVQRVMFAVAVELKARLQDTEDPSLPDAEREAATRAVLDAAAAEPRASLAWLAREGDASAQALVHAEALPDAALSQAAPAIVLRALLQRSREGEGRAQTLAEWLSSLQRWTDSVFDRLTATIEGWGAEARRWIADTSPSLSVSPPPAGTLEGLRHALSQLSDKHTRLREQPPGEERDASLAALDRARARLDGQVVSVRALLSSNLRALASERAGLAGDHDPDALAPLDLVLHLHMVLLQNLSTAA